MHEVTAQDRMIARLNLARGLRHEKKFHAARGQYEKILEMPGASLRDRLEIRLEIGHALLEARDFTAARAEYAKVAASAEASPAYKCNAQLRIADCYVRQKKYPEAQAEFGKLLNLSNVKPHLKWEAQERIKEIERLQAGQSARDPAVSRKQPVRQSKPAVKLYVSVDGKDADTGTKNRPFATLERARDEIRARKRKGELPTLGVAVFIRGGEYKVKETFKLTAEDSGTEKAPIIYCAYSKEKPRFAGGVRITGFNPVQDAAVLARLPDEARGKVWQIDLKAQGINDYGKFEPAAYGSGRGFVTHPMPELYFNGKPMEISRWPNDGFVQTGDMLGTQLIECRRRHGTREGMFTYDGDRPNRWKQETDIWLYGYWFWDWADSYEKVASVDTEKRIITLASPYHRYGYRKGMRYYALNLLSEIDKPGEWYLDRNTGILYFYPPSDPNSAIVEISMFESPFVELDSVSHVTFRGLMWELGRGDGLHIKDGEHCLLAGCTVRRFAGDGVVVNGGVGHGLLGCDIYTMGRGGTRISGGDRKTLTPSGHCIENCHIYNISRIDHTYTPAVLADGVGIRIAHNLMHDVRSSAMRIEGNDHLVEFNEVHTVVWESDDQGGVDMYGNPTYRGNVYRYNYWHHIIGSGHGGLGQAGIRLDDAISGTLIYGNVFYRCSNVQFGGIQIHGGKDNIVDSNLFLDCKYGISFTVWGEKRWKEWMERHKSWFQEVEIEKPPYSTRYPELAKLYENADVNHVWRNIACNCGEFLTACHCDEFRGIQDLMDNCVVNTDKRLVDPSSDMLQWKEITKMCRQNAMPPIPFDEIGLYKDEKGK